MDKGRSHDQLRRYMLRSRSTYVASGPRNVRAQSEGTFNLLAPAPQHSRGLSRTLRHPHCARFPLGWRNASPVYSTRLR